MEESEEAENISQAIGTVEIQGFDYSEVLPRCVVHAITRYLNFRDIAHMAVASPFRWSGVAGSKKIAHLHISNSSSSALINVDDVGTGKKRTDSSEIFYYCETKRLKLMDFADNSLRRRKGLGIQRMNITSGVDNCTFKRFVERWIHTGAVCYVKNLEICIHPHRNEPLNIYESVFSNTSLRVLRIVMITPGDISFGNLPFVSHLHELYLEYIGMLGDFLPQIAKSCTNLQIINFVECYGVRNLIFESDSIVDFKFVASRKGDLHNLKISGLNLRTVAITWISDYLSETCFTLLAPDLRSLTWVGYVDKYSAIAMENLSCATIKVLYSIPRDWFNVNRTLSELYQGVEVAAASILQSAASAEKLQIGNYTTLIIAVKLEYNFLSRELTVPVSFSDYELKLLADLLWKTPWLMILSVKQSSEEITCSTSNHDSELWDAQDPAFLHTIRKIEITASERGLKCVLKFIKKVVENAKSLEHLTIWCSLPSLHSQLSTAVSQYTWAFRKLLVDIMVCN
ncbi:hypothetical protein GIB67_021322 [Kingdonia uniflora]|uniref:F-box/LRR-repeat protein 15/At3g58940/PEG3-like LRR domain-containing protein n=1 Tax=Kingdonia uniflora TaxID=39325 RepID=A0A7J7LXX2_9MAGN|nr:hypothetical protein GIB67_021322 [Kingdonia uniflora]